MRNEEKMYEFCCRMAFDNVSHCLGKPQSYGYKSWSEFYEVVLADCDWKKVPEELQEEIGSEVDWCNFTDDLMSAYSVAEYVVENWEREVQND